MHGTFLRIRITKYYYFCCLLYLKYVWFQSDHNKLCNCCIFCPYSNIIVCGHIFNKVCLFKQMHQLRDTNHNHNSFIVCCFETRTDIKNPIIFCFNVWFVYIEFSRRKYSVVMRLCIRCIRL